MTQALLCYCCFTYSFFFMMMMREVFSDRQPSEKMIYAALFMLAPASMLAVIGLTIYFNFFKNEDVSLPR